jgi:FAD/FMN-containing dehydrogenase
LVARPTGVADVMAAVRMAREYDIALAVRGGGHSGAGKGTLDDGIVLDLSSMRRVRVDPATGVTYTEGGAQWCDYDHETQPFAVATPGGVISTTGVGGFTLGGGIGWISRKFGLTCDNLIGAELVDAEGRRVVCDQEQSPDLLWALRGAGGNFGVVTGMKLRHHYIGPTVYAGAFLFSVKDAERAFALVTEFGERDNLPRELGVLSGMVTLRDFDFIPKELHWQKACSVAFCWTGDPTEGKKLLSSFAKLGPAFQADHELPYKQLQCMFDVLAPHGNRSYWKTGFVNSVSPAVAKTMVEFGRAAPSPLSQAEFMILGGKIAEIPNRESAFGDRTGRFVYNLVANWTDAAQDRENIAWTRNFFDAMQPFSTGAAYANYLGDGDNRARDAFGENYDRLSQLKAQYDPTNFFKNTQNVPPASTADSVRRERARV